MTAFNVHNFLALAFVATTISTTPVVVNSSAFHSQQNGACADPSAAIPLSMPTIEKYEGLARCVGKYPDRCSIVTTYPDPAPNGPPTICYGHTGRAASNFPVHWGMKLSRRECSSLLFTDAHFAAADVCRLVKVSLTNHQLAALVSFTYNLGSGTLARSSLLRALNQGKASQAGATIRRYCYAGDPTRPLPGLLKRRLAEEYLWTCQDEIPPVALAPEPRSIAPLDLLDGDAGEASE